MDTLASRVAATNKRIGKIGRRSFVKQVEVMAGSMLQAMLSGKGTKIASMWTRLAEESREPDWG